MLVDTDIFIDLFRNNEKAVNFFKKLDSSNLTFSAITEAELLAGSECNDTLVRENILHFLAGIKKLHVDNGIAQMGGDFYRRYGIKLQDALIAASAFQDDDRMLVTRNLKDFSKIKEIKAAAPY